MAICDVCGNEYDKAFRITLVDGSEGTFDSFECAAHRFAPTCEHCGCRILGHGVEADGRTFCCASCARMSGVHELADREGRAADGSTSMSHAGIAPTRPASES